MMIVLSLIMVDEYWLIYTIKHYLLSNDEKYGLTIESANVI